MVCNKILNLYQKLNLVSFFISHLNDQHFFKFLIFTFYCFLGVYVYTKPLVASNGALFLLFCPWAINLSKSKATEKESEMFLQLRTLHRSIINYAALYFYL